MKLPLLVSFSRQGSLRNISCCTVTSLLALTAFAVPLYSQTSVTTTPVGYTSQSLPAGADTMIVPQVQRASEFAGTVSSVLSSGSTATLSLAGSLLTANAFKYVSGTQPKTYYALVTAGNLIGTYFTIVSNGVDTITVNLDGLTASSSDITAIECRPYWTLNTLFPPSDANVSFVPSSSSILKRTQLLLPDSSGSGINRAAAKSFFYLSSISDWVSTTATSVKAGDTIIPPDQYLIHRNTGGTPSNLAQTVAGSLLISQFTTYLSTLSTGQNDNYISIPRATDYTLSQLGFTDSNFTQSPSKILKRDQLLVYSTTGSGINRAATKTYFKYNGAWYDTTSVISAVDPVIPAGSAFCVRKYASDGFDKLLTNQSNVSL
jgi:uncharacterized protein (TIGR02597 family)